MQDIPPFRPDGISSFYAESRAAWRAWLAANHQTADKVWLIMYHKKSGVPSVYYDEAVDEALCFGWIDSKPAKRNAESYYQYFSKRKPKSNWSGVNKDKVTRLAEQGLMTEAGWEMVTLAKKTGTWTALDAVIALEIPKDLQRALEAYPTAEEHFQRFPASVKRALLEWISSAKQPATRAKRILETAQEAAENRRANQYRPTKKPS
ncbi:MAG: YdeI/OmpD-associated family protein [Bacteroidetes Order II. Incertae sedis bacterium]|nr:YdeI/OmpD-associated family protein [Bacteroidetes Order II. bacterium]